MLDGLDDIPWQNLSHAYGSAGDVPDLLRALQHELPCGNQQSEDQESALYALFGNIWHQGTVYEATPYAVPFLLELAVDKETPDRVGILSLLHAVANGYSDASDAADQAQKNSGAREHADKTQSNSTAKDFAAEAREAVKLGFSSLLSIAQERDTIGLAAAHVLTTFSESSAVVGSALRQKLHQATSPLERSGILILLGAVGDRCDDSVSILAQALESVHELEKIAATIAIAKLKLSPLPPGAKQILFAILKEDHAQEPFLELPWEYEEMTEEELVSALDESEDRSAIVGELISLIEAGHASASLVHKVVNLHFPTNPPALIAPHELSPQQRRAVHALYKALREAEDKKTRVFYGHLPCWGLPDSLDEWRKFIANT